MAKHLLKFNTAAEYSAATINKPAVSWVVEDNEVKYDPYIPPYVEIGGVKWAKMNIGAETETDAGLYFQWGDISGYTASQVGSGDGKKAFNWENYKYSDGGSTAADMTKYNGTDKITTLEASDDAATANLGSSWRMPTEAEFQSLIDATTNAWVIDYNGSGIRGRLFTDKTDSSKVLFFPAAGYCDNGSVNYVGSYGRYWSSSLNAKNGRFGNVNSSYYLDFNNASCYEWAVVRCFGFAVRPVHV